MTPQPPRDRHPRGGLPYVAVAAVPPLVVIAILIWVGAVSPPTFRGSGTKIDDALILSLYCLSTVLIYGLITGAFRRLGRASDDGSPKEEDLDC